jgi:acetone carboxylase gamma subunit
MWSRISEAWCKSMHSKAMWPIHGKYICPDCLRAYPVVWDEIPAAPEAPPPRPAVHPLMGIFKRFDTM